MIYALAGNKTVKPRLLRNHSDICRENYMKKAKAGKAVITAFFAYVIFNSPHFNR